MVGLLGRGTRHRVAFMGRDRTMRNPELAARAGYTAADGPPGSGEPGQPRPRGCGAPGAHRPGFVAGPDDLGLSSGAGGRRPSAGHPRPLAAEPAGRLMSCRDRRRNSWPTGPRPNRRQPGPRTAPWTGPALYVSRAAGSPAVMPVLSRADIWGRVPAQPELLPFPADQLSLEVSQLRLSLVSGKAAKLTSRGISPLLPNTSGPGTARPRAGPRHRDAERASFRGPMATTLWSRSA